MVTAFTTVQKGPTIWPFSTLFSRKQAILKTRTTTKTATTTKTTTTHMQKATNNNNNYSSNNRYKRVMQIECDKNS